MGTDSTTLDLGRVTKDGALIGYLAVDTQQWSLSQRVGLRSRKWSETRRRYRLDLLNDWDEGFLSAEDEVALAGGRFQFKGEIFRYEELAGDDRAAVLAQRFSEWE